MQHATCDKNNQESPCRLSLVACRYGVDGFTLIELLIAATMMSVLFIGLGGHLRGGISVWRQTTQRVDALQRKRVAMDRLERDLANGIVYDAAGDAEGQLPRPEFTASSLAWYTVSSAVQPPSVRRVAYACEVRGQDAGLWRGSQSVGEARVPPSDPSLERLLTDCDALQARYAYAPDDPTAPLVWLPEWLIENALPRLIEVTVPLTKGQAMTRVFAIPHGSLERVPGTP